MGQLFSSYFWAGYECNYATTREGKVFDQLSETKHDVYCRDDYQLVKEIGISTVREGLSWSQIDRGSGVYDFSRFERLMQIAQAEHIQQIWSLNHFDYPLRLDPFSDAFVRSFAEYAKRAITVLRKYISGTITLCPINEISFFSLIGAEWGTWMPGVVGRGWEFKKQLARAAIAAMDAIWTIDPDVIFLHVDPLMRRVAKDKTCTRTLHIAQDFETIKYQAYDLMSGRIEPELGGKEEYLGILGANYYIYNQEWVIENNDGSIAYIGIPWRSPDRVTLTNLLDGVYERYRKPLVLSETGAWGALRQRWWRRLLTELQHEHTLQLPLLGVCAYPIIDRTDWVHGHLTNSGLWDFQIGDTLLTRYPQKKIIGLLRRHAQHRVSLLSSYESLQ